MLSQVLRRTCISINVSSYHEMEPIDPQNRSQRMDSSSEEIQVLYEVEAIEAKRSKQKGTEYFIKWKGFRQRTWEPLHHLENISEMIYEYEEKQKKLNKDKGNPKPSNKKIRVAEKRRLKKLSELSQEQIDQKESEESRNEGEIVHKRRGNGPRLKVTDQVLEISESNQEPAIHHYSNIYVDQVERILKIEKLSNKYMALVKFKGKFDDAWHERDLIRQVCPEKLLVFYEQLSREKQNK